MADNNFKGGPGGRLKAAAANFNKPTMQDSLDLYNNALKVQNYYQGKQYRKYYNIPIDKNVFADMDQANVEWEEQKKIDLNATISTQKGNTPRKNIEFRKNIDKNKFNQREQANSMLDTNAPISLYDKRITPTIRASYANISETTPTYGDNVDIYLYDPIAVKPVSMLSPKERIERERKYRKIPSSIPKPQPKPIPVIKRTVSEGIEPMAPRQAPVPSITPSEMAAPVMRPVPQSNLEPQDGPMGFALRYPAQTLMNRVKARITGQPNMPYWVDREGVKRYPSMGENRPEEVKMTEMLKSNLNPNVPEDASELKKIDLLRKMAPKDRRNFMNSYPMAQE